ncbi:hypothetical protein CNR22_20335 [Sphingobacteriaceae bacterium]|nr:hypothetical protein CNR22_20335 [Sphingobacteriaceae bacterium]
MNKLQEIRNLVRKTLMEGVNNFLQKDAETNTKQLEDNSKAQEFGDPISDIKMNQMANELGSDGQNAQTVAVKVGEAKGGNGPESGQRKANFQDKTELAEATLPGSEEKLREYISIALNEKYGESIKKEEEIKEGAAEELIGEPIPKERADEIDEAG